MTLLLLGGILGIAYTLRLILHRPAKGVSEDVEAERAERSDSQAVRRAASTPQLTRSS
jgi:hypothetical protein